MLLERLKVLFKVSTLKGKFGVLSLVYCFYWVVNAGCFSHFNVGYQVLFETSLVSVNFHKSFNTHFKRIPIVYVQPTLGKKYLQSIEFSLRCHRPAMEEA